MIDPLVFRCSEPGCAGMECFNIAYGVPIVPPTRCEMTRADGTKCPGEMCIVMPDAAR